jgi:hypothetical protein
LHPEQFDTELALRFVLLLQAVTKVSWSVQQPAG